MGIYIRRGDKGIRGFYGTAIGMKDGLPVLAWVDTPLYAQEFPAEIADRILERLRAKWGAEKTYWLDSGRG